MKSFVLGFLILAKSYILKLFVMIISQTCTDLRWRDVYSEWAFIFSIGVAANYHMEATVTWACGAADNQPMLTILLLCSTDVISYIVLFLMKVEKMVKIQHDDWT